MEINTTKIDSLKESIDRKMTIILSQKNKKMINILDFSLLTERKENDSHLCLHRHSFKVLVNQELIKKEEKPFYIRFEMSNFPFYIDSLISVVEDYLITLANSLYFLTNDDISMELRSELKAFFIELTKLIKSYH